LTGIGASPTACLNQQTSIEYGHLPLAFEANAGQTDSQVKFLSRGRGYGLFLTGDEAVLKLQKAESETRNSKFENRPSRAAHDQGPTTKDAVLRMKLLGANSDAKVTGLDELSGKSNYFLGNDPSTWVRNAPTYAQVRYEQVYPGIDLVYYGSQGGQLEYDFVVAPGADAGAIALNVGAGLVPAPGRPQGSPLRIAANGDLVVPTDGGEVRFHKPVVYQEKSIVDSPQLTAQDEKGNSKLETRSSDNHQSPIANHQFLDGRFVLTAENQIRFEVGPYDHSRPLVIDPVLVYSTYLGGSGQDSGNAYLTGSTSSTDFPTSNPYQGSLGGSGATPTWWKVKMPQTPS
jgi:hypothetical protein